MCITNNHQLWSRNIYDHELMVLSTVPKDKSKHFFDLDVLRGKRSIFCFGK